MLVYIHICIYIYAYILKSVCLQTKHRGIHGLLHILKQLIMVRNQKKLIQDIILLYVCPLT